MKEFIEILPVRRIRALTLWEGVWHGLAEKPLQQGQFLFRERHEDFVGLVVVGKGEDVVRSQILLLLGNAPLLAEFFQAAGIGDEPGSMAL